MEVGLVGAGGSEVACVSLRVKLMRRAGVELLYVAAVACDPLRHLYFSVSSPFLAEGAVLSWFLFAISWLQFIYYTLHLFYFTLFFNDFCRTF